MQDEADINSGVPDPSKTPNMAPRSGKKRSPVLVGVLVGGAVLTLVCACIGVVAFSIGGGLVQSFTERPKVGALLDELMQDMSQQDANAAYELLSTRARRTVSLADIEALLVGNNGKLFSGYQSLEIATLSIGSAVNSDPNVPQGTVATVVAEVSYDDGYKGTLNATLERQGDEWAVAGFHINVPPDKLSP